VPLAPYEPQWKDLVVPATALLAFPFVTQNFHGLIEALFATIVPIVATGRLVPSRATMSGFGTVARGGGGSIGYFASEHVAQL